MGVGAVALRKGHIAIVSQCTCGRGNTLEEPGSLGPGGGGGGEGGQGGEVVRGESGRVCQRVIPACLVGLTWHENKI